MARKVKRLEDHHFHPAFSSENVNFLPFAQLKKQRSFSTNINEVIMHFCKNDSIDGWTLWLYFYVQNPYRHRPVLRENEWQNCGKKFDFKSLKWRIISLVQPFLSGFFLLCRPFWYVLQKIITKWSYRYFLWLLICRQKKSWIITAKWVITMFKRQPVNHPKKFLKKILYDRENVQCISKCLKTMKNVSFYRIDLISQCCHFVCTSKKYQRKREKGL